MSFQMSKKSLRHILLMTETEGYGPVTNDAGQDVPSKQLGLKEVSIWMRRKPRIDPDSAQNQKTLQISSN